MNRADKKRREAEVVQRVERVERYAKTQLQNGSEATDIDSRTDQCELTSVASLPFWS